MRKITYPLAVFFVILATSLTGFFLKDPPRRYIYPHFCIQPSSQTTTTRSWRTSTFRQVLSVAGFQNPVKVVGLESGIFFVLDLGDSTIRSFTANGKPRSTLSLSKLATGRTPSMPTDFYVASNGDILVCDPRQKLIATFTASGAIRHIRRLEIAPYRIAARPSEMLAAMPADRSDELFVSLDDTALRAHRFGHIFSNQKTMSPLVDGVVTAHGDGRILFAGLYGGYLAAFALDGKEQYLVQSIDWEPLPRLVMDGNLTKVEEGARRKALSIGISGQTILVFSPPAMDAYALRSGEYLFSYRLPNCNRAFWTGGSLYAISGSSVSKWLGNQPS